MQEDPRHVARKQHPATQPGIRRPARRKDVIRGEATPEARAFDWVGEWGHPCGQQMIRLTRR